MKKRTQPSLAAHLTLLGLSLCPPLSAQVILPLDRISVDKMISRPQSELTVATGAITVTGSHHTVDTEGDASTDDLVTINGGEDGQTLIVRAASDARTVVLKRTGNIQGAADVTLDDASDIAVLVYDGGVSKWTIAAIGASAGGGGGVTTFLNLTDTPSDFTDQAGKMLVVNEGETALEFAEAATGGGGAPTDATYLTTSANGTLSAEVVVSALTGNLTIAGDDAAGRTITLGQQVTNADTLAIDVPSANVTIDGDIVSTLTATQTLTNKTITTPILTVEQGTNPTNTTEGRIQWDTDDDALVIGTGAGTITIGAGGVSTDIVNDTTPQLGGDLDANGFDILFDSNTGIQDANDASILRFVGYPTAVNYWDIRNSAAGNRLEILTQGSDTNVGAGISLKGAAGLRIGDDDWIEMDILASAPASASAGKVRFFALDDGGAGKLYAKNSAGTVYDLTAAGGGGGTGTMTTIQEGDVGVGGADIVTLDFNGSDFDLSESPDTEVNVAIAAAITRDSEWDTAAEINAATTDEDFLVDSDIGVAVQAFDADLADLADGTLSESKIDAAITRDSEWDTAAEINAATTDEDFLVESDIGVAVQAYSTALETIDGLTFSKGNLIVYNGSALINLGVGSNGQVLTADSAEAAGVKWAAAGAGSGSAITLDLGDDGGNDSTDLTEIAIGSGDTNGIFSEPSADKLLIDMTKNWPSSDSSEVALTGDSATAFFSAGTIEAARLPIGTEILSSDPTDYTGEAPEHGVDKVLWYDDSASVWRLTAAGAQLDGLIFPARDDFAHFKGSSDPTARVRFDVGSNVAGSTTRVITVADENIDMTPTTGSYQGADADLTDLADGTLTGTKVGTFTGDTGAGGAVGAVPAPAAGDAAAGKFLKADGTWAAPAGGGGGATYLVDVLGANFSTTSTTVEDVTGFNVTLEADTTYHICVSAGYSSSAGGEGVKVSVDGPTSPAFVALHCTVHKGTGSTGDFEGALRTYSSEVSTTNGPGGDTGVIMIQGVLRTSAGNGGVFQIELGTETGLNSSTLTAGSTIIATPVD